MNAIHKHDPLTIVPDVFADFNKMLSITCRKNKNVKSFESRFEAQLVRFNTHGAGTILQSLIALTLPANFKFSANQRVYILAIIIKMITLDEDGFLLSRKELFAEVKYDSIASVRSYCDQGKISKFIHGEQQLLNGNRAGG